MVSEETRRDSEVDRLQEHFLVTANEDMAMRFAERLARSGTAAAVEFLVEQAAGRGHHAEAAIHALLGSAATTGSELVRAIEARPNEQNLVRALPADLPGPLARRLLAVIPRIRHLAALRYLVQRVAVLLPEELALLRRVRTSLQDRLLGIAFEVGLAAAGDSQTAQALEVELARTQEPMAVRLMLSCRALAQSEAGQRALAELFASTKSGDRAYALAVVGGLGLTECAEHVARCYLIDEHESVAYGAIRALPLCLQHLQREQLTRLIQEACQSLRTLDGVPTAAAIADQVRERVRVWSRAAELVRLCHNRDNMLVYSLLRATAHGTARLGRLLMLEPVSDEILVASCHVGALQQRLVQTLWLSDRMGAALWQAKLVGMIEAKTLERVGSIPSARPLDELLDGLIEEARVGAVLVCERLLSEHHELEDARTHGRTMRNTSRRVLLLRSLLGREEVEARVVATLEASREREVAALEQARKLVGDEHLAVSQTVLDERVQVPSLEHGMCSELLKRATRGVGEDAHVPTLRRMLAEQILQADLVALLAVMPAWRCAGRLLIVSLEAVSGLVRAAARDALSRHREAADDLEAVLNVDRHPVMQAHALEILRCLSDARALDFARRALHSTEPLLQAAAVKYLGRLGRPEEPERAWHQLHQAGGVVTLALEQTLVDLYGPCLASVQMLVGQLGNRDASASRLARYLLCGHEPGTVLPALEPALASEDAYTRVSAERVREQLRGVEAGGGVAADSVVVPVAGDVVLGQCILTAGEGPWQWGLPGLPATSPHWFGKWAALLETDEEVARSWEDWMMSGRTPHHLLPRLQAMACKGGAQGDAATALALDILVAVTHHVVEAFWHYHGLEESVSTASTIIGILERTLRRCDSSAMWGLDVPNPSPTAAFPEMMLAGDEGLAPHDRFAIAYCELVKDALSRGFPATRMRSAPDGPREFRAYVEEEWDELQAYQDPYYGFQVAPRISLDDMARYCSDPNAKRTYRRQIASYLGYMATTTVIFPEKRVAARRALFETLKPRLRAGALKILSNENMRNDLCSHDGFRRAEKALRDEMEYEFSLVVKRFDVFRSKPVPRWPLGTLSMAWEPLDRQRPTGDRSEFAERHLPLAHLIERMVRQVIREELATSPGRSVDAMSFDQPTDDGSDFGEVGETLQEAREREERLLDSIDAGTSTEEMAYAKGDLPGGVGISAPTHDLVVDGNEVKCLDIRGAAQELGCSETTLRRYGKADKIRFIRQKGYRYLPERELDAARIELRRTGEWATMLGVSKQTVRNWMRDMPSDTDPFERERLLRERAARKGKHRR